MLCTILGLLQLIGVSLGPVESLSFAVVVGLAVDYIVHLSFAYKGSLLHERYYRSRSAFLARANSVVASGITTLCAVMPLLGAQLDPLQRFGLIFTVVAGAPRRPLPMRPWLSTHLAAPGTPSSLSYPRSLPASA